MSGCAAPRHGDLDAYMHYKCRCPAARRAHTLRMKHYRLRRMAGETPWIDATGTRRRIQALAAIGWTFPELGSRLGGVSSSAVSQFAHPNRKFVMARTAAAVDALYVQLSDTPGGSHFNAVRCQRRGWLPPAWWDDDTIDDASFTPQLVDRRRRHADDIDQVVVQRLVAGEPLGQETTRGEKVEAYRRLIAANVAPAQIQQRLRISGRTLYEIVAAADASGITEAA